MNRPKSALWDMRLGVCPITRKVGLIVYATLILGTSLVGFGSSLSIQFGDNQSTFSFSSAISMLALGLIFMTASLVFNIKHERLRNEERQAESSLANRIKSVESALRDSSVLFNELRAELETRTIALEKLQVAAVQHERLAALNAEQAAAVQQLVSTTISAANRVLAKSTLRQQIVFYALGLISGIPVTLLTAMLT